MHPIEFTIPSDYKREQRLNHVRHSYKLREMLDAMIPERSGVYLLTQPTPFTARTDHELPDPLHPRRP